MTRRFDMKQQILAMATHNVVMGGSSRHRPRQLLRKFFIAFHNAQDRFKTARVFRMSARIVLEVSRVVDELYGHYCEIMYVILAIKARSTRSPEMESRRSL